jgi:hypothetical protein
VGWLLFSVLTNFTEFDNSDVATFVQSNSVKAIDKNIPQNQDLQAGDEENGNTEALFYSLYTYDISIKLLD